MLKYFILHKSFSFRFIYLFFLLFILGFPISLSLSLNHSFLPKTSFYPMSSVFSLLQFFYLFIFFWFNYNIYFFLYFRLSSNFNLHPSFSSTFGDGKTLAHLCQQPSELYWWSSIVAWFSVIQHPISSLFGNPKCCYYTPVLENFGSLLCPLFQPIKNQCRSHPSRLDF